MPRLPLNRKDGGRQINHPGPLSNSASKRFQYGGIVAAGSNSNVRPGFQPALMPIRRLRSRNRGHIAS